MGIFYRKPFLLCCFFAIMGAIMIMTFNIKTTVFILLAEIALLIILVLTSVILKNKRLIFSFVLPLICAILSSLYFGIYFQRNERMISEYVDENIHEIEAIVNERSYLSNFFSLYSADCISIDGKKIKTELRMEAPFYVELEAGDIIKANVIFTEPDMKLYNNSKGIYLRAEMLPEETEKIGEKMTASLAFMHLRNVLVQNVYDNIERAESAGLICAIFLGDRDGLSPEAKRDFSRTGGYHLLALSGMHLSIFCVAVIILLRAFRLRKGKRNIILALVVVFYVALTGFQLSMIRSAIMLFAAFGAYYLRSKSDSVTALAFAASAIIVFSPSSVLDGGLWMSVLATLGILIAVPFETFVRFKLRKIERKVLRKIVSYITSMLIFSTAAGIMVFPLSWYYFGGISLLSPLTTLVLTNAVSFILVCTPIAMMISWIPFLSDIAFGFADVVSRFVLWLSEMLSKTENIFVSLEYDFVPYFTVVFFGILFVLLTVKLKRKWIVSLFALIGIISFFILEYISIYDEPLTLEYTNLGKNEYFSVSFEGKNVLIDVSDGSYSKMNTASSDAISKGFCELDAVILTHLHGRHINSLARLSSSYMVRSVYIPEPKTEQELTIANEIENVMGFADIELYHYGENELIGVGEAVIDIDRSYLKRSTHPVVGITFSGAFDLKYYGSSYSEYEEIISCENVIFGIHGPVCKKDFSFDASECAMISFADVNIYSKCTIINDSGTNLVKELDKLVFKCN